MKNFTCKDEQGLLSRGWAFGTFKATQVGVYLGGMRQKPRQIAGWQLRSPDGCLRYCEGNWQQFVPFAQQVIQNYGCTSNLS